MICIYKSHEVETSNSGIKVMFDYLSSMLIFFKIILPRESYQDIHVFRLLRIINLSKNHKIPERFPLLHNAFYQLQTTSKLVHHSRRNRYSNKPPIKEGYTTKNPPVHLDCQKSSHNSLECSSIN